MRVINIHEAKTQLSRLVEQAANGDEFIIAKAGKPLVKVVALEAKDNPVLRKIGFLEGQISVPDDFDHMGQDEIERQFGVVD
jgi:prevent-host-death family protein